MTTSDKTAASLAAKVDAFALTLPAPEQVLLAVLIGGDEDDHVVGFGARPIWPGLANLVSPERFPTNLDGVVAPELPGDGFVDIVVGDTDV